MTREFVAINYLYEDDAEDITVNPNIIVYTKTSKTIGNGLAREFPWTVTTVLINLEEVDYYFKTKEEAKVFTRKVGNIV